MSKIVICSTGGDSYDHDSGIHHEIVSSETWGDGDGGSQLASYIAHYKARLAKNMVAWVTINEIDIQHGRTKCWLKLRNPLKQRIEVNLPAKELKSAAKVVRKRSAEDILMSVSTMPSSFFASTSITQPIPHPIDEWQAVDPMPTPEQETF